MPISILNNIPSLAAQNQLSITGSGLQKTLFRLSSGSRINSGADDAAGLAIADGLRANVSALSQSARNATDGVGKLQVADGALAQVTNLLNRAVTLATEATTGTVNTQQRGALNSEFTAIKGEIQRIGTQTTFNGAQIFVGGAAGKDPNKFTGAVGTVTGNDTFATVTDSMTITDTDTGKSETFTVGAVTDDVNDLLAKFNTSTNVNVTATVTGGKLQIVDKNGNGSLVVTQSGLAEVGATTQAAAASTVNTNVFLGDGTTDGDGNISVGLGKLLDSNVGFNSGVDLSVLDLTSDTNAKTALEAITTAIGKVAADRGTIGAGINRLQSATTVINAQVQNLSAAEDGIRAADIAQEVANMTKFNILNQTGISALAQANQMQQAVLSLLR